MDHVWTGGPLHEAIPETLHGTFGRLLASHVIEHLPDLIGFLRSAAILLAPDGVLALAVPDRRYSFDYFKPPSTTADILAAQGALRHSRKTLFQQNAYSVSANTALAFGQMPISATELIVPLETAWAAISTYSDAPDSPYVDAHAWHFTPAWFRLALIELADGRYIDWHAEEVTPTVHCEFIALLRRGRPVWASPAARDAARRDLLVQAMAEAQDQLTYASAGGLIAPPLPIGVPEVAQEPPNAIAEPSVPSAPLVPPPILAWQPNLAGLHPLARAVQRLLSIGGNRWFGPPYR